LRISDGSLQIGGLKPALDGLYDGFNVADSATDPIQIVRRYSRDDDRDCRLHRGGARVPAG
jgi:hypothetical protein